MTDHTTGWTELVSLQTSAPSSRVNQQHWWKGSKLRGAAGGGGGEKHWCHSRGVAWELEYYNSNPTPVTDGAAKGSEGWTWAASPTAAN